MARFIWCRKRFVLRSLAAVATILVLAVVLAGCGGAKHPVAASTGQPSQTTVHQSSHTTVPDNLIFWTPTVGLLELRECGAGGHKCRGADIELTTDGGHSYHLIRHLRGLGTLYTLGSRGADLSFNRTALRTLDRGRTWKTVSEPSWGWQVQWATPQTGLRVGPGLTAPALSTTHDGGRTWQRLPSPCHGALGLGALAFASFPSPSHWWLACHAQPERGGPPDGASAIFSTVDAGKHWTLRASNLNGTLHAQGDFPIFALDGFGFFGGGYPNWSVSRDGGKTLARLPAGLIPVSAFNGGIGFAMEREHPLPVTLLETRDYGRTWHAVRRWNG
ncbi:MAG TPA: hypothetical protein VKB43_08385 [Gaiellaceae bacterium]|nr:hypothetical protein [Gaiellaceae bacterium]